MRASNFRETIAPKYSFPGGEKKNEDVTSVWGSKGEKDGQLSHIQCLRLGESFWKGTEDLSPPGMKNISIKFHHRGGGQKTTHKGEPKS